MPAKQASATTKPQATKKDAVKKEAPAKEAPKAAAPKKEAPKAAAPKAAAPAAKAPAAKAAAPKAAGPAKAISKTADKKKVVSKKAKAVLKVKKAAVRPSKFQIELGAPVQDGILDPASFEKFLHDRFKVATGPQAKAGVLGDKVTIGRDKAKVTVTLHHSFKIRKAYLKYLTKKYLKKQQLSEWLRVVSTTPSTYELRYFNIQENEAEDEVESDDEN